METVLSKDLLDPSITKFFITNKRVNQNQSNIKISFSHNPMACVNEMFPLVVLIKNEDLICLKTRLTLKVEMSCEDECLNY